MIKLILVIFLFAMVTVLGETLSRTGLPAKLRMKLVTAGHVIGLKSLQLMKKCRILFRIIIELLAVWFVFEWNGGIIISAVKKAFLAIYHFLEPLLLKIAGGIRFISPYGRNVLQENSDIRFWMFYASLGVLLMLCINCFIILSGTQRRFAEFMVNLAAMYLDWYAMFAVVFFIVSRLPQEDVILCWAVMLGIFVFIQVFIMGILFGIIFDKMTQEKTT